MPKYPASCYNSPEPKIPTVPASNSSALLYVSPTPTPPTGGYDPPYETPTTMVTAVMPPYTYTAPPAKDYTGDILASLRPVACDPSPLSTKCDISTSCTSTGGPNLHCAYRGGFRSSAWNVKNFSKQFRVPGQPFVYVAPGVVCDKLCDLQYCAEVMERPLCM
jgi:hypothetical protein